MNELFEGSLVDGVGQTKRTYTILFSLLGQLAAIVVLVVLPLVYFDALPQVQTPTFLNVPPPPPPPPPKVVTVKKNVVKAPRIPTNYFVEPTKVPKEIKIVFEDEPQAPINTVSNGLPSSNEDIGKLSGNFAVSPPTPPAPKVKVAEVQKPLRVGGNVQMANLIKQPKPLYPAMAKAARVQGTVRFQATIAKDRTIQNLQLLGGPPLLVQSAMQAVEQWQYSPTLLNGERVEVITTIDVNFTLQ